MFSVCVGGGIGYPDRLIKSVSSVAASLSLNLVHSDAKWCILMYDYNRKNGPPKRLAPVSIGQASEGFGEKPKSQF